MIVSTFGPTEPCFVLGAVFSRTEIRSGFFVDLKNPEQEFNSVVTDLSMMAARMGAHAVFGVQLQFVDSRMAASFLSSDSPRLIVLATGTAVQLYRYLNDPAQRESDERYRQSLLAPNQATAAMGDEAIAGLRKLEYKGVVYFALNDGRVRSMTPKGWADFNDVADLKDYHGLK